VITPKTLAVGCLVRVRGRRGPWRYLGDGWFGPKNAEVAVLRPTVEAWAAARRVVEAGTPSVDDRVEAMLHRRDRTWSEAYEDAFRLHRALSHDGCWGPTSPYVFSEQRITLLEPP